MADAADRRLRIRRMPLDADEMPVQPRWRAAQISVSCALVTCSAVPG
jgi:hypothetical protein